jgi:hypothetical protein
MPEIVYEDVRDVRPQELAEFYRRLNHKPAARPEQVQKMLRSSDAFVAARADGELIGIARGVSDGVRGYLTECKLDPAYQGPAAVTRTDGRIEHDTDGIAAEMARRVLERLFAAGSQRIDVIAWGTEQDFLSELGFRRSGGLVGMTLQVEEWSAAAAAVAAAKA